MYFITELNNLSLYYTWVCDIMTGNLFRVCCYPFRFKIMEKETIAVKMKTASDKEFDNAYTTYEPGPYEIVLETGEQALTDAQLLAVILRTGIPGTDATGLAKKVLSSCDTDRGLSGLNRLSIADMVSIEGIGKVKAVQLRCLCEIAKRMAKRSDFRRLNLSGTKLIADYYMPDMAHLESEKVVAVLLDARCRFIRDIVIAVGSAELAFFKPKDIFCEILKWRADSFVLLHNHPTGDPTPSISDITMTKKLEEGAGLLGLRLFDHIVIGNNCYISMKDEGMIGGF